MDDKRSDEYFECRYMKSVGDEFAEGNLAEKRGNEDLDHEIKKKKQSEKGDEDMICIGESSIGPAIQNFSPPTSNSTAQEHSHHARWLR